MAITAYHVLGLYWKAIKHYKKVLFLMLLGIIVAAAMELLVPIYYGRFFDILTAAEERTASAPALLKIIFLILGLNAIMWVAYRIATFSNNIFQSGVMATLRQNAFDYLIEHSYGFFSNQFTGSLVQKVNRLARAFERFADRVSWNIIPLFIRISGVLIILWFINQTVTFILIGGTLAFLMFNYFFSRWKLKYDLRRAEADSRTTGVLADAITNQNTIQLFTGSSTESQRFKEVSNKQKHITRFTWDLDAVVDAVQALFIILIEFFLFYFAIRFWKMGIFTVGTFVLIHIYLAGLIGRLWDFSRVIRDLYESFADAKEMAEILFLPHEIQDAPTAAPLNMQKGEVEFKNVWFHFHQTRPVLKGIHLKIRAGEKVALVGPSGAGKSTLVRLLLRLHNLDQGEILIDGQNIHLATQKTLRDAVALVPQDPILFHRTLMENIRYGRRDAADEDVLRAARLAHCDEFINGLPKKYNTYVGERGVKLSGGERQRVAIARAILKNAPILVLDEATSSLDSHSESLIQDALQNLMAGRTTLVIAHRLSTIRKMDRIVVIDEGNIIEEGTHEELIARPKSLYRKLWTLQAGGFLVEEENGEPAVGFLGVETVE